MDGFDDTATVRDVALSSVGHGEPGLFDSVDATSVLIVAEQPAVADTEADAALCVEADEVLVAAVLEGKDGKESLSVVSGQDEDGRFPVVSYPHE